MATKFRLSSLIPAGLIVERSDESDGVITVSARAATDQRSCPLCNRMSDRIHSRYVRIIADLPCAPTRQGFGTTLIKRSFKLARIRQRFVSMHDPSPTFLTF
ncbi:hypothetical protein J2Z75_005779 [Rhizobium herbae]|uniref:Transposase IS204/IS1001/IS1096/IS1165 zinc-finger domain-containing protein n=1 Tax=Rhizobium herbae TaxID=508661 RepID=A0ABS4EWG7_9HYPH|nr:hypothetical protein [Rhizobium herbae]MBP1862248.1 hypothetical protein [Rhizobium herbae]